MNQQTNDFPDTPFEDILICLKMFMKKGYCHIDGKVCTINFVEDQREFVEHLQIGKQIGKLLDMPKRPQAQKHIFWIWNMKNLETWFQNLKSLKNIIKMFTQILCVMAVRLFQTSSRGSGLKQNRFG